MILLGNSLCRYNQVQMGSYCIRMGLNLMCPIFLYEELKINKHIEKGMPYDDAGRIWCVASTSQQTPKITGKYQKLGRGKGRVFPRNFRGIRPVDILVSYS